MFEKIENAENIKIGDSPIMKNFEIGAGSGIDNQIYFPINELEFINGTKFNKLQNASSKLNSNIAILQSISKHIIEKYIKCDNTYNANIIINEKMGGMKEMGFQQNIGINKYFRDMPFKNWSQKLSDINPSFGEKAVLSFLNIAGEIINYLKNKFAIESNEELYSGILDHLTLISKDLSEKFIEMLDQMKISLNNYNRKNIIILINKANKLLDLMDSI
ncbi:MAG: hypothetical protein ACTSRZ_15440 [Promethearchaeota archaeon]